MKKIIFLMAVVLMSTLQANAQKPKIADKELLGTWTLEWMQYDGEKRITCGKGTSYTSFKYYGANGEYACAEIALSKDGKVKVLPHEYGTYSYKDGWYIEMGRKPARNDILVMKDNTHFHGRWMNRTEAWKKTPLSQKVVKYILDCCKSLNTPADVQQEIKKQLF